VEDRLTLLPLAPGDRNVPLSPDDSLVAGAVRQAASMFELVIVDVGSICEPTGRLLKRSGECLADAAIVVRDVRRTDQEQAMAAAARFHAAGLEAVAIVENFGTGEETAG
jgi:hypothetical protein